MQGTIWDTGCSSFYIDETGRNSVLWPDWTWRFRHRADRFSPAVYELTTPSPAPLVTSGD